MKPDLNRELADALDRALIDPDGALADLAAMRARARADGDTVGELEAMKLYCLVLSRRAHVRVAHVVH